MRGASEKDQGSLYMAQFAFGADGEVLFCRRKLKPTHVERALFGEGDGSHLHVQEVAGIGRLGALNCWEHLQPLTKFAMYSRGEEVHVAGWPSFCLYRGLANALDTEVNINATQVYAVEGSCFTIAVIGTGGISHWPATPDSGKINEAWDREFLDRWCRNDREALCGYDDAAVYTEAGQGGFEIRTFVATSAAAAGAPGTAHFYAPIPIFAVGCTVADYQLA